MWPEQVSRDKGAGAAIQTKPRMAYLGVFTLLWVTVAGFFLVPGFTGNEDVYLLRGQQLLDHTYLAADWLWGFQPETSFVRVPFDWFSAGLGSMTPSVIATAIIGRGLMWMLVLAGLVWGMRAVEIAPLVVGVGTLIWLFIGQSWMAGEWVLGGVESKVFAYACLFFAIGCAAHSRWAIAGGLVGVAVWSHVLVGAWGGFALGVAALLVGGVSSIQPVLRYSAAAALVGMPALVYAAGKMLFVAGDDVAVAPYLDAGVASRLFVEFRNPHHLDPAGFLTPLRFLLGVVLFTLAWLASRRAGLASEHVRLLRGVMLGMMVCFALALVFRSLSLWSLLKFYPARVADTLLPLFTLLILAQFAYHRCGIYLRSLPGWERTLGSRISIVVVVVWLFWATVLFTPRVPTAIALATNPLPDDPLVSWVHEYTEPDDVLAVHPCLAPAYQYLQRAQVVSFKSAPVAPVQFSRWYERLNALADGASLTSTGFAVCEEVTPHFRQLDTAALLVLRAGYNADYYLIDATRDDLEPYVISRLANWTLVDLAALEAGV